MVGESYVMSGRGRARVQNLRVHQVSSEQQGPLRREGLVAASA